MIIGVTGTNGAGKGTVVDYLVQKGFHHYSMREAITEEIIRRGLPVTRTNMNEVATDLRKKYGADYYTTYFMADAAAKGIADYIIESIRNPKEAENICNHGGLIWVVDADKHIRFERIMARKSVTDQISFDEFVKQEDREMTSEDPNDPAYMDIGAVIAMAGHTFHNNGTLEELHKQIDAVLAKIKP